MLKMKKKNIYQYSIHQIIHNFLSKLLNYCYYYESKD